MFLVKMKSVWMDFFRDSSKESIKMWVGKTVSKTTKKRSDSPCVNKCLLCDNVLRKLSFIKCTVRSR